MRLLELDIIAIERGAVTIELKNKAQLTVQWQGNPEDPQAFLYVLNGRHAITRTHAKAVLKEFA